VGSAQLPRSALCPQAASIRLKMEAAVIGIASPPPLLLLLLLLLGLRLEWTSFTTAA